MNELVEKMIERRVSKGNRRDESDALLADLLVSHSGDNLAHALVYNDFATERQAYKFIATI